MATIDELGEWESLGSFQPPNSQWANVETLITPNKTMFRFSFQGEPEKAKFKLLIRSSYVLNSSQLKSRAQQLIPSSTPTLLGVPFPVDLENRAFQYRQLQIKKIPRFRKFNYFKTVTDSSWTVSIEQLIV